jgi:hypothetical protein
MEWASVFAFGCVLAAGDDMLEARRGANSPALPGDPYFQ